MLIDTQLSPERRSFLSRLKFGAAGLAAIAAGTAQGQTAAAGRWEPARHDKDAWLDKPGTKHRMVFDTIDHDHVTLALLFTANYLRTNESEYGVKANELSVVVILRYRSVSFGYNDAIWAKYGESLSRQSGLQDPKTNAAPKVNPFNAADYRGNTLDSLSKQGVQFAVCSTASRNAARAVANATGGDADAIYGEMAANLVAGGRIVPAGIVTVTRAQERGYALVSA